MQGDFLMDQATLNQISTQLKTKFKNKIQEIALEYCIDSKGEYINWNVLRIKKSQQSKGYGSSVMSEIVQYADNENVRIKLLPTNLWGSDVRRLRAFCQKYGFTKVKDRMIYYPKKH
jgi:GNAT superfamily N-acetyltransferase